MEKEFDLSDERKNYGHSGINFFAYPEEKVKEFIRLDMELIKDLIHEKITWIEFYNKRRELAGDKLK